MPGSNDSDTSNYSGDRFWTGGSPETEPNGSAANPSDGNVGSTLDAVSNHLGRYVAAVYPLRQIAGEKIVGLGRTVSNEIMESINFDDVYALNVHMEARYGADSVIQRNTVDLRLQNAIFDNIARMVKDVAQNGRQADSIGSKEEYYNQMVIDSPLLETMLLKKGAISAANFAKTIPVQDLLRARLPGVGEVFLSEVHERLAHYIDHMPEHESAKFYADLHAAAPFGTGAKIAFARDHLDPEIGRSVAELVQDVSERGPGCHADPDFHRQMIDAKSVLSEMLLANGRVRDANVLHLLSETHADDRSSGSPVANNAVGPRSRDRSGHTR